MMGWVKLPDLETLELFMMFDDHLSIVLIDL